MRNGLGRTPNAPRHICARLLKSTAKHPAPRISICGLGFFELYINGARVSGDVFAPVTSDYCKREFTVCGRPFPEELRHRVYYVKYDVSGYLQPGKNAICVALGPGLVRAEHMD